LRQVFPRVPDHPLLAGITAEQLRDWRGEATILPPRLKYNLRPRFGPTVEWCGLEVPRLWRCGTRGNVASVLIEKPACGDFLPIADGGYSLQYSPLMEYREGKGVVLFCQIDVTSRSESEPCAETLVRNIFRHVTSWKPTLRREVFYAGEAAGKSHLESAGITVGSYDGGPRPPDQILVIGPGAAEKLRNHAPAIASFVEAGGNLLSIGLGPTEADELLPIKVPMKNAEHIASFFEVPNAASSFAGIGPSDVHNRDPREFPLITAGAATIGDGVLAKADGANVVFCQMAPWKFDASKSSNLKRTHRRVAFMLSRLLANMGGAGVTPLLDRFSKPVDAAKPEKRWLDGLYVDRPEEWDDPYRHFRW
jgi:beta-galactosidase